MPPKTHIHQDQGAMFIPSTRSRFEYPVDPATMVEPVVPPQTPEDGPSVNIIDRANALNAALTGLAQMSRTAGLEKAAMGPHRQELEKHMDDVDAVVGRSAAAQPHRLGYVKRQFADALGMQDVVSSGLLTEDEAKENVREDFKKFTEKFADAPGRKARDAERTRQERNIDIARGLPARKPRRNPKSAA